MKILQFLNQNSYVVLAFLLVSAVSAALGSQNLLFAIPGVAVLVAFLFLIYSRRVVVKQPITAQTPAQAAAGKPTLIEFYSDL